MQDFVFFKVEKTFVKLRFFEILFVQAEKKYVNIVTAEKSYLTLTSISYIEAILPRELFCRIHRSYIISLQQINKFDSELVYIGNKKIPIAEQYREVLKKSIIILNGDIKQLHKDHTETEKSLRKTSS